MRIPIWVRVPGVIVAVLVAVLVGAVVAGAAGVGGGAGPDKHAPVQRQDENHHRPPAGGHG